MKFFVKNIQNKHLWSKIYAFLFFCKVLHLDKFKGVYFKYDNIFSNLRPKNTESKRFWSQIWAFVFLTKILQLEKFNGADFKYDNIAFKFGPQNT